MRPQRKTVTACHLEEACHSNMTFLSIGRSTFRLEHISFQMLQIRNSTAITPGILYLRMDAHLEARITTTQKLLVLPNKLLFRMRSQLNSMSVDTFIDTRRTRNHKRPLPAAFLVEFSLRYNYRNLNFVSQN